MPAEATPSILLVDDQADWIRINRRALQKEGFDCEGFTDKNRALKAFSSNPEKYRVVIMDVKLGAAPNGIEMAKKMLAVRDSANIVLVSTDAQIRKHSDQLEDMAKRHVVKYARKTGDEHGAKQVVEIARSYLVPKTLLGQPREGEGASDVPSGGLLVWLESAASEGDER